MGFDTRELEKLDTDAAARAHLATIRRAYPRAPDPTGAVLSRWAWNPVARGSYLFMPPGSSDDAFGALGAPVGRIFFAGAETIPGQSGTVHGAWRSGERAAEEVDSWLEAEAGRIGGTPAERPAATAHRHGLSFPRTLSGRDCLSCHGS